MAVARPVLAVAVHVEVTYWLLDGWVQVVQELAPALE